MKLFGKKFGRAKKLAAVAVAAAMLLSVAACTTTTKTTARETFATVADVYGMGAVTTVELLGGTFSAESVSSLANVQKLADASASTGGEVGGTTGGEVGETGGATDDPAKEQVETLDKYFNMLDAFIGESVIRTAVTDNTDEGYTEYAHKLTVTSVDLDGNTVEQIMYYNETAVAAEIDVDDDDDDDDDDDGDELETEAAYTLDGVLLVDGVDYALGGERSESVEGDETEAEIVIRAYLDIDDKTTYVEVKQETETETGESEKEYIYSVYASGSLVERTKVEFETEVKGQTTETEVSVEFVSGSGRGRYELERTVTGEVTEIEVSYNIDGKRGKFTITRTADGHEYTFADGEKLARG